MEGLLGMIKLYISPQTPENWCLCDGRELNIADFPDLFALIGTRFGGDGETTFALPELKNDQPGHFMIRTRITPEEASGFRGMLCQIVLQTGEAVPEGWMPCRGQEMSVSDHPEMFGLLQNRYGGDGVHTFALPNLPELNGIPYLICTDGMNPVTAGGGGAADDDDL